MNNENGKGIFKKLLELQKRIRAPKSQRNEFGNFNYRSAEGILEAAKPILSELGLALLLSDSIEDYNGIRYICSTAKLVDTETGETVMADGFAREADTKKGMDVAQVTGSTSSYARKYALNGLLILDDARNDPDAFTPVAEISKQTRQALANKAKELSVTPEQMKNIMQRVYHCESSGDLTEQQGIDLLGNMTKYLAAQ